MEEIKHTAGPWRWEINPRLRRVELMGGTPRYDLAVMTFERWGMNSATPCFNTEISAGNLNVMVKAEKLSVPAEGRGHHSDWFRVLNHPDAELIARAPDLLKENESLTSELSSAIESYNRECKRNGELQAEVNELDTKSLILKHDLSIVKGERDAQKEEIELYRERLTQIKAIADNCSPQRDYTTIWTIANAALSKHQPIKKDETV
jgi:hypothetical protein